MKVHLVDGTYELFRHYYAVPKESGSSGQEIAATRGVLISILGMLEDGATHVAVATDHIIESFRNDLWEGYKDGTGIEPDLLSQFELLEDTLRALGVTVWPMIRYEADDALAAGAHVAAADPRVEQVLICTPDKDLAQCVDGSRVVQLDRRKRVLIDQDGVVAKFGVHPASIPDLLALVGDSSDGYPGLKGWGAKSAATVLARYHHLEHIPKYHYQWKISVRGAANLATTLVEDWDLAILFRQLATLATDAPVTSRVDDLEWGGPTHDFPAITTVLGAEDLLQRADRLAGR